jgi:hypothetical protein
MTLAAHPIKAWFGKEAIDRTISVKAPTGQGGRAFGSPFKVDRPAVELGFSMMPI